MNRERSRSHQSHVDSHYLHLMKKLLDEGAYPAIATQSEDARRYRSLREGARSGAGALRVQMLYGIRRVPQCKRWPKAIDDGWTFLTGPRGTRTSCAGLRRGRQTLCSSHAVYSISLIPALTGGVTADPSTWLGILAWDCL